MQKAKGLGRSRSKECVGRSRPKELEGGVSDAEKSGCTVQFGEVLGRIRPNELRHRSWERPNKSPGKELRSNGFENGELKQRDRSLERPNMLLGRVRPCVGRCVVYTCVYVVC